MLFFIFFIFIDLYSKHKACFSNSIFEINTFIKTQAVYRNYEHFLCNFDKVTWFTICLIMLTILQLQATFINRFSIPKLFLITGLFCNTFDYFMYGYIRQFLLVELEGCSILCNLADIYTTIGVILFIIMSLKK